MNFPSSQYVGRFAPSPSGPLHMGSLVCALACYLDAKAHSGHFFIRIEDIDPPREISGAALTITNSLSSHGLKPDADVTYQSDNSARYDHWLSLLKQHTLIYPCNCTRARLKSLGGCYDGHCLDKPPPPTASCAWRINTTRAKELIQEEAVKFDDSLQGAFSFSLSSLDDFVVHRKDGLYAYQMAVVLDDISQGVTQVVRGYDLLDTTAHYVLLHRVVLALSPAKLSGRAATLNAPRFTHIPVLVDRNNHKLSKQNHAPSIDDAHALENLQEALGYLGFRVSADTQALSIDELLSWAIQLWPTIKPALARRKNTPIQK